jgi:uncharacterized protein (TIGR03083 family)
LTKVRPKATLDLVDPQEQLSRLRAEAAHVAAFVADRDPAAPVPSCPGMTSGEVVRHLGSVYRMVTGWVRGQGRPDEWERAPQNGRDPIDWFRETARDVHDELAGREPDDPCDTWVPGAETVGFWWRRMAHETTVHRTDIEAAHGPIGPIDSAFAVDGADEVLTRYLVHRLGRVAPPQPSRRDDWIVGVSAGSAIWRVERTPASIQVSQEIPYDADAVVMADPAAIYLWLWGRRSDGAVRVNGDPAAAAELRTALASATG